MTHRRQYNCNFPYLFGSRALSTLLSSRFLDRRVRSGRRGSERRGEIVLRLICLRSGRLFVGRHDVRIVVRGVESFSAFVR